MAEPRVACRTPAEGRDGVTNIPQWKFDLLRRTILGILREDDIAFKTLKLEFEMRGEVVRVEGQTPQVIGLGAGV